MSINTLVRASLREPLLQFLLAGLVIFILFSWQSEEVDSSSRTIVIDAQQVERLSTKFADTYQRPPTPAEIDGLIHHYIEEEIYYREALRLGLDVDDAIIRRRLHNKMKSFVGNIVETEIPSDTVLQAMLDNNPERYLLDTHYSFDQVYLSISDSDDPDKRAASTLNQLQQSKDWQTLGDRLSVPPSMNNTSSTEVKREFGLAFSRQLDKLAAQPLNNWYGPISSGFGKHLIRIRDITPPEKPTLNDIRQQLENDWRRETMQQREAAAYQLLLDSYTINIEKP